MANDFYTHSTYPATGSQGSSSLARAEFDAVSAGFDKMPALSGNAGKFVVVNTGASGLTVSSVLTETSGNLTSTGRLYMTNSTVAQPAFSFTGDANTGVHHPAADQLQLVTAGTPGLTIDESSRVLAPQIHNNAAGAAGTTPMLASGTYTPTFTAISNCSSPSGNNFSWVRVGNVVTVSGVCTVTVAASSSATQLDISLPVASDLTAGSDLAGTAVLWMGASALSSVGVPQGDATNNRCSVFAFSPAGSGSTVVPVYVTFQYQVK